MINTEINEVINKTAEGITVCVVDDEPLFSEIQENYPRRNVILRDQKYMITYMIGLSLLEKKSMLFVDCKGKPYLYKTS